MTIGSADLARLLVMQEIEDFLYREAELLDERRYQEWLDLLNVGGSERRSSPTPPTGENDGRRRRSRRSKR